MLCRSIHTFVDNLPSLLEEGLFAAGLEVVQESLIGEDLSLFLFLSEVGAEDGLLEFGVDIEVVEDMADADATKVEVKF